MKEHWSNYMRVGICYFMVYPQVMGGEGPILETMKDIVEDDFFDVIEITWIKDAATRKKAADLLRSSHMTIGFAAQPPLLMGKHDLNSLDEDVRKRAVQQVKECIDQAVELGATRLALLSGKDPGDANRGEATKRLIHSLKEICRYADGNGGIQVVLETFDRTVDKRCLIGPAPEAVKVSEEVRREFPSFGIMYDLSHLPLLGEDPEKALSTLGDHLVHIHIGNCIMRDSSHPGYGDAHPRFGIEGGENDVEELAAFLRALFKVGYLGSGAAPVVSFEVKPLGGESPAAVVAGSKRTLRSAWTLV